MQFIYSDDCGKSLLKLHDELYKYLIKVRRFTTGEKINFRKPHDDFLYIYKIESISKKEVFLTFLEKKEEKKELKKSLEIFWCVVDTKTVEKTLPILNQIGVKKITFIYCDRSQKNFKLDFKRFERIVLNSNQQCGRVDIMEFELAKSLKKVLEDNEDIFVLDFGGDVKFEKKEVQKVLVGCEGGFSQNERELFSKFKKISFDCDRILKSESATTAIASKLLL